ncbi:MAG: EscU/YscU/HrcU family type III secretion system export apparatus switch protein, partial [Candidatus Krumholzibacteria bacterium]|nr:EscU/YscU/HrcU family type III secretion system export apparatus switch protein [Candidatus Krumholzibacteria bacterium]
MAEQSHQEKTELATPRRRKEARKKGQVARSTELSSFAVILAGLLSLLALSPLFLEKLLGILTSSLSFEGRRQVSAEHYDSLVLLWTEHGIAGILPFWGILLFVAFGIAAVQVGLHVQWDQLAFKGERISPLRGFKRIFSIRSGFELIKSLLKFAVLLTLAWITLNGEKDSLMNLAALDLGPAL